MFVVPAPSLGDVFVGRDASGRVLRVTAHPDSERVVLSIWQDGSCLATVRLATHDVPDLVRTLTTAVLPETSGIATVGASADTAGPGRARAG